MMVLSEIELYFDNLFPFTPNTNSKSPLFMYFKVSRRKLSETQTQSPVKNYCISTTYNLYSMYLSTPMDSKAPQIINDSNFAKFIDIA